MACSVSVVCYFLACGMKDTEELDVPTSGKCYI